MGYSPWGRKEWDKTKQLHYLNEDWFYRYVMYIWRTWGKKCRNSSISAIFYVVTKVLLEHFGSYFIIKHADLVSDY